MGGKKRGSTVVGYRYYWDIHSGLGRGPVDEIVEIRADDKTAYVGTEGEITRNQAIYINKPDLFGGEATGGEGGLQGRMEIMMGEANQKPTQSLANLLKGIYNPALQYTRRGLLASRSSSTQSNYFANGENVDADIAPTDVIPGFRGIVSTFFSGLVSCYNAYPKRHSYRVRAALKGWQGGVVWYPEKCMILLRNDTLKISGLTAAQEENVRKIKAMNPAHILVRCFTDKTLNAKLDLTDLDLDAFKAAADTLYDEGFGLCIKYNSTSESMDDFVQSILNYIGAATYQDSQTGKVGIKLLRQDYDADKLHTFDYDNGILKVIDDDSSGGATEYNQVIVTYLDPVANAENQAKADNIASIKMHGINSNTVNYKGVPTYDLAARLAQRDLEMGASGLTRLKITFDTRASELKPGDVFKVSLPDRDIDSVIFRVGQIENGQEPEQINVICVQDVFGLPASNYSSQAQGSLYTPPDYSAKPAAAQAAFELPYHVYPLMFSDAELATVGQNDAYIAAVATAPTALSIGFDMQTDAGAGFETVVDGAFTADLTLETAINKYQTVIKYATGGDISSLSNAGALLIDNEIVRVDGVDYSAQTITIARGCADTVPQAHNAGARAWAYLLGAGIDPTKYAAGEQVKARLLTKTARETLAETEATAMTVTTRRRQARPYPPGNVKIDGVLTDKISNPAAFTLSWAHRDRVLQADNLIAHTAGSTTLAAGTSYIITLINNGKTVRQITTTADSLIYPDADAVTGEVFDTVTLMTIQNGLTSLQYYTFTTTK